MAILFKRQLLSSLTLFLFLSIVITSPRGAAASTPTISAYQLTYLPARVSKGFTQNVRLRCEKGTSMSSNLEEIDRIRIMKQARSGSWRTVAQITDYAGEIDADDGFDATGWMDYSKKEAFLEITWAVAGQNTFGVYKCDVVGFDKHLYHGVEATPEVEITEQKVTSADIFSFVKRMKDDLASKVQENANRLKRTEADKRQQVVSDLGKDYVAKDRLLAWPTGQYGLLQPRPGCPVDLAFYGGDTGYVRYEVEPIIGDYSQFNLAGPILGKTSGASFVSLYFCVVTRIFNSAPWPNGTYCVHQKGGACPATFQTTRLNGDIDSSKFMHGGTVPDIKPYQFCCKDSGSPDQPIILPTESPFYLYRYGSQCQQVENMDVTPEDLRFQPSQTHVTVTLDLCYYMKRNGTGEN